MTDKEVVNIVFNITCVVEKVFSGNSKCEGFTDSPTPAGGRV